MHIHNNYSYIAYMQVLGALAFGTASATVAMADFAMRERMLDQPIVRRVFLHGGLVFICGLFGLATACYAMLPSGGATIAAATTCNSS